jgi:hypothetical protein
MLTKQERNERHRDVMRASWARLTTEERAQRIERTANAKRNPWRPEASRVSDGLEPWLALTIAVFALAHSDRYSLNLRRRMSARRFLHAAAGDISRDGYYR